HIERGISRRWWQAAAGLILVNHAELPGGKIGQTTERGAQMPFDMIEMAVAEIEMDQSKALGIAQHQTYWPPARTRRRDERCQPRKWLSVFHLATPMPRPPVFLGCRPHDPMTSGPPARCTERRARRQADFRLADLSGYPCARGAPHVAQYISPSPIGCPNRHRPGCVATPPPASPTWLTPRAIEADGCAVGAA